MIRCRPSVKVGRSARPTDASVASSRGSVATISEYTGATARPQTGQPRRVALGGAQHHLGGHRPRVGLHPAGLDAADAGLLEDRDPRRLHHARQSAHQPRGVDRRAVRGVRRPEHAVGGQHRARLVGVEQPLVVLGEPAGMCLRDPGPQPLQLHRGARQGDRAPALVVRVDPLGVGDPADLAHRLLHRAVHAEGAIRRRRLDQLVPAGREQRAAPAAVAAGGAEAGHLRLEHRDPERRVGPTQVVRRPEPGQAGAHHDDVVRRRAGQRRTRYERVVRGVVPEREGPVVRPAQRTPHE